MPIKQLQLRGITRTPSDRATADGGCAESLNVHLDQQETAPTLPPEDISANIYGENTRYRIVYIHKMPGIVNYIACDESSGNFNLYAYGSALSGGMDTIYTAAGTSETLTHVASIGNTLIVYSDKQPHYFLFKGSGYLSLGSRIPIPAVEVVSVKADSRYTDAKIAEGPLRTSNSYLDWNSAANASDDDHAELLGTMTNIWDAVSVAIAEAQTAGVYVAPFFLRYALRLYDGSYIYTSTPILCGGASTDNWVRVVESSTQTETDSYEGYMMNINFLNAYRVWLHGSYITGNWADIVRSIDFFASTPIYAPAMNAEFYHLDFNGEITFAGMGDDTKAKTIRDEVMSKGQFYKVMSIELNDTAKMGALSDGTLQLPASSAISGEGLAVNDDMPDGYRDGNQYIPTAGTMNFNNRLLLLGAKEMLSHGDRFLNGQATTTTSWSSPSALSSFTLRFKIVDSATGAAHYVLGNYNSGTSSSYYPAYLQNNSGVTLKHGSEYSATGTHIKADTYAWICYPDTRCTEVEVFCSANVKGKRIPMEPHPYLNCACAFLGFGVQLRNPGSAYAEVNTPSSYTEDPLIEAPNKLFLSEFENPFIFPAGNIVTLSDNVVGAATTSVPLSEGQFGDFPLYVFTEGGIRMMVTTGEGTFAQTVTPPNLSRHVALPGTVLGMEQAVVFTTERGVMLLSGSQVTELSRNINGAPFILNGATGTDLYAVRQTLNTSPWGSILSPTSSNVAFMSFMKTARPAYDHNGARLIWFNPTSSLSYQYAYMLETQTWHKVYNAIYDVRVLNSYPDCLISVDPHAAPAPVKVFDYSTVLDSSSMFAETPESAVSIPQPVRGIIVTRPFDLGEPDIRKAIRDIRIRGDYNRGDVKYILLGSMDNHSWKHLTSLRGGSYKLFRLILLTNLMPKERITWIDIDYESRFTNKLR